MEYSNISALLEKYWACETTVEEELQLREFYAGHEGPLPPDLQEAAALFCYYHAEGEPADVPALFTDRPAPWDAPAPVVRPIWQNWMKYAAVLLMAVGVGYAAMQYQQRTGIEDATAGVFRDTYKDPKLAYQETQRALQILSKGLNRGKHQMEKLRYFSEATDMVEGRRN
ncbi:hypothetical protein ACWKWU_13065 [Chitinophaga lutea]